MRRKRDPSGRVLVPVAHVTEAPNILWELLSERPTEANISHKKMPTWPAHCSFVARYPYRAWYLIKADDEFVGAIYFSRYQEVGISIFKRHQRKGHAKWAILELLKKWGRPDRITEIPGARRAAILANIAPANEASKRLFEECGFQHISDTYAFDVK